MVIISAVALDPDWSLRLSDAQSQAVSGRIGVALSARDQGAVVLSVSGNDRVAVDLDGDGLEDLISMCLTETQVHLNAQIFGQDTPAWTRAFSLGYDVEPTC